MVVAVQPVMGLKQSSKKRLLRGASCPQASCGISGHQVSMRERMDSTTAFFFFSFLSFFFLNAPGGFLPAASWLPGWRDKADILKALPQAIPLLPMVQELEPKLHRELEARRDSEKSGLSPGATGTEACHCLFSPTRPLHICVLFGGSFS